VCGVRQLDVLFLGLVWCASVGCGVPYSGGVWRCFVLLVGVVLRNDGSRIGFEKSVRG
jgi:hypothetical protein